MACQHGYYKTEYVRYQWMNSDTPDIAEQHWVSTEKDISLHAFQCTMCGEVGYYSQAGKIAHEQGVSLYDAFKQLERNK